jgi:catechol 2,3-dioxygenase-like lactoylglutathione lyase family enzyme
MAAALDLSIDHVHLYCSDLDATERWFITCFGAELLRHRMNRTARATDLRLGGMTIFLRGTQKGETLGPAGPSRFGTDHIGFRVRDLAAAAAELKQRGVEFDMEPHENRPGLSVAFVRGPDAIRIELLQYD